MPFTCFICKRNKDHQDDIRLFKVPAGTHNRGYVHKNQEVACLILKRRLKWCEILNISTTDCDNVRICSNHFLYGKPSEWQEEYSVDWYPNRNLGPFADNVTDKKDKEEEIRKSLDAFPISNHISVQYENLIQEGHSNEISNSTESNDNLNEQAESSHRSITFPISIPSYVHECVSNEMENPTHNRNEQEESLQSNTLRDMFVTFAEQLQYIINSDILNTVPRRALEVLEDATNEIRNFIDLNFDDHKISDVYREQLKNNNKIIRGDIAEAETQEQKISVLKDEIVNLDLYKILKAQIPTTTTESQTDLTGDEIEDIMLNQKMSTIEKIELVSKLSKRYIDKTYFKEDNKKTRYYTGLHTYSVLQRLYEAMEQYLPIHYNCKLVKFQMLVLTLMKLRLDLDFTDLGYRFAISTSSASHYFHKCIYVLDEKFNGSNLIYWPDKDELVSNQPSYFKDCFKEKVVVVADCFETFTQRPSNKKAAAQSFSHYKHHHTVKYMLGISLRGAIIFVSKSFGGRSSDKHITSHSGFLNKLKEGDYVLVDRGFLIQDMVAEKKAKVFLPCFTKNKNQLSSSEVEATRYIAHIRIHVERLIGTLKQKYRVFSGVAKISALSKTSNLFKQDVMDKIAVICSCLVNLCPSIINDGFW